MTLTRFLAVLAVVPGLALAQTPTVDAVNLRAAPSSPGQAARLADLLAAVPSAAPCLLYGGTGTAGVSAPYSLGQGMVCAGTVISLAGVPLGSIAQGGAAVGQVMVWTGTGWAPATPAVGGGTLPTLAAVATSGRYTDLSGLPAIPAAPNLAPYALAASLKPVALSGAYADLTGAPAIPAPAGPATATTAGLVKPGPQMTVGPDGTLAIVSQAPAAYTGATASSPGLLQPDGTYLSLAALVAYVQAQSGGAAPAAPGQVTGLTAGAVTASSIALSWTAPSSGGGPTGYTVTSTPSGGTAVATSTTGTGTTLTGLAAGRAYSITVAATNGGGSGPASEAITASTAAAAPAPATNVNTTYTVRNVAGSAWASALGPLNGSPANSNAGRVSVRDASNNTPASIPHVALSSSATVVPVNGAAGGDYGVSNNDSGAASLLADQASYPQEWQVNSTLYVWPNGHAAGTARTLYAWYQMPDATWALLTNADGTPFAIAVTY